MHSINLYMSTNVYPTTALNSHSHVWVAVYSNKNKQALKTLGVPLQPNMYKPSP